MPGTTLVQIKAVGGKAGWYCGRWGGTEGAQPMRYYKLEKDLDMTGYDFSKGGIGGTNKETAFAGVFDGNGHIIKNWNSTSAGGTAYNGIFSYVRYGLVEGAGIKKPGC